MANYLPSSVICFIDIDAFEVQLYQREQPQFRNSPCVVANSSGLILAASYEAKAIGISRLNTPRVAQAKKILPSIKIFWKKDKYGKQDSTMTRHATFQLLSCVNSFFGNSEDVIIELASSDEMYLDVSALVSKGMEKRIERVNQRERPPFMEIPEQVVWETTRRTRFGPFNYRIPRINDPKYKGIHRHRYYKDLSTCRLMFGTLLLNDLLSFIRSKIYLEASGGVGNNRFLAKIACGLHKPQRITVFDQQALENQLRNGSSSGCIAARIGISDIPGLKGVTGLKLKTIFGATTMLDLQQITLKSLSETFGQDLGHKIFNFGRGYDNTPVIDKQLKTTIKCNKPAEYTIKSSRTLKKCIQNLCAEISELLYEELVFHKRTVKTVRVEFVTDDKTQSQEFDISSQKLIKSLSLAVLNFSKTEIKTFAIKNISFELRNFIRICDKKGLNSDVVDSSSPPEALQEAMIPKDTLRIATKNKTLVKLPEIIPIGGFRTTIKGKYASKLEDLILPTVKPFEELDKLVDIEFDPSEDANNPHILITDYGVYHRTKHSCFVQWLQENLEIINQTKVDFVSFNGRFAYTILTPLLPSGCRWDLYALNFQDIIFLWNEKLTQLQPTNKAGVLGLLFERLVTSSNDEGAPIVETDKIFNVDKLQLGRHNLLVVNQVDCQTADQKRVQVSVQSDSYFNPNLKTERNLQLFGQCLISGCENVILGTRTGNRLNHVETFDSLKQFAEKRNVGNIQECLQFQSRFLSWIKFHLPVSNRNMVKRFSWMSGGKDVKCFQVLPCEIKRLIVPRIYAKLFDGIQAQTEKNAAL